MQHRHSRSDRRHLVSATGTALAAVAVASTVVAPSGAATSSPTPRGAASTVTVRDPHNDVEKNFAPIRRRKGPLDIYWARARFVGEVVAVTVRVADLRPAHTRDVGTDGSHTLASLLAVAVKWGKHVEYILYAPGDASGTMDGPLDDRACPEPDPTTPYDISGLDQVADYDKNTYTFTIPISCLPAEQSSLRVSAYTGWGGEPMSIPPLSDHITRSSTDPRFKWSPPLAFR